MKKLIAALLTAALLTLGLVAVTAGASEAKYVTHRTKCSILGSKHAKHGSAVGEAVELTNGAKGRLVITVTGPHGFKRTIEKRTFILGKVKKGVYRITAKFTGEKVSNNGDGWSSTKETATVTVK